MISKSLAIVFATAALVLCFHGMANASDQPDCCLTKAHKAKSVHSSALSDKQKLAQDYRARRAGGDNRNCPCAGSASEYCSCAVNNGYRDYSYGGGGYSDPYATAAGWSRGTGYGGSDIPTSGYTPDAE